MEYREEQPWGSTIYKASEVLSFNTSKQKVEFITNPYYGRMLFLDGVLQSATADEHIYHQTLVAAGISKKSRWVLIVGGAEGAVAREVLKWPVHSVHMVDWDMELVQHCHNVEGFNIEAFENNILSYYPEDILSFCKRNWAYDTVFLDMLDIDSEDDYLFMKSVVKSIKCSGTLVMNVGRSLKMAERFGEPIAVMVPSFQEPWYLARIR